MKTSTQLDIELPRIKRVKKSWTGKVIQYLMEHPSGSPSCELAIEAIAGYWLIEALENKVSHQQLVIAGRNASEKLGGKLTTIRKIVEQQLTVNSSYTDIKNELNLYVELSRVKRAKDSWEGQVIQYLLQHPSNKPVTELVIEAITSYWLVEALLEHNVAYSEIVKASRMAIEKLGAKLTTIDKIVGTQKELTTTWMTNTQPDTSNKIVSSVEIDSEPNDELNDSDDEDWSDFLDDETRLLANILGS
ncbi:hypothetical protein NOS3756_57710 (plasmid) [Nostoc sp. NIES-3756]|uniref:hypothetical protein n=1 Tax=Nostoc sp. NIES-3756 TaxID=1751286 RepID=UPI000722AF44|nr:hypothetical protein [Nostoc sp. NIES-3756]BAT56759.1 hypothetical protein NOS3756_57710 [Nostoc sp. NIES-3756]